MSLELEEFFESSFKLRKILEQVLPKEAIDYILDLIAKDNAHHKFLKITKEEE
jgi:transcription termination factor Rho